MILVRMALILNFPRNQRPGSAAVPRMAGSDTGNLGAVLAPQDSSEYPQANRSKEAVPELKQFQSSTLWDSWPCLPDSRLIYIIYVYTYMYIHMSWCGWKTPLDIAANAKSKAQLRTFFATSTSSTSFKGVAMQQSQTEGRMPAM